MYNYMTVSQCYISKSEKKVKLILSFQFININVPNTETYMAA
jgi:hypothetical protein